MPVLKKFKLRTQVWRWPGDMGWHFITIPKNISEKIQKIGKPYGSGFIRSKVQIGKTVWQTALFPYTRENVYLIAVKKSIRQKECIFDKDMVSVFFTLI